MDSREPSGVRNNVSLPIIQCKPVLGSVTADQCQRRASVHTSLPLRNSQAGESFPNEVIQQAPLQYFHSRRISKESNERPWKVKKDPRETWVATIPFVGILIGLGITATLVWDGFRSVVEHKYCAILDDDFSHGLDVSVWTQEAEVGGFGNGQFEETTLHDGNVAVEDGVLYIKPTVREQAVIENNVTFVDLLKSKICSSNFWSDCVIHTNLTNGTIINPVASARLNTKKAARIKYGRVEVEAKLPAGDWLWPAIWMLPNDNAYGEWPRSGEIDIVESRGNNYTYSQGGNNIVSSSIHWGPNSANDRWWQNHVKREALHSAYSDKFHIFGLEWSEDYMFTYIDTRLLQIMYTKFDKPFWSRGRFPLQESNGSQLLNPWPPHSKNAPFDQDFYLLLNVAVGGTNGWFEDGKSGKPWVDGSARARLDFWNARAQWQPTWQGKRSWMAIKSVKMWQQQGYNGCEEQAVKL